MATTHGTISSGVFAVDSYTLDKTGVYENDHVKDITSSTQRQTIDDGFGSLQTTIQTNDSDTTSQSSFHVFDTKGLVGGQLVTTFQQVHQEGTQTFTVAPQTTTVQVMKYFANDHVSWDNVVDTQTNSKSGFESFTLDKDGSYANDTFAITSLTLNRSGHETYSTTENAVDTSHTVTQVQTLLRTEDDTIVNTMSKTGADTYTLDMAGHLSNGALQMHASSNTQTMLETYTQTVDATSSWVQTDSATGPSLEIGSLHNHRAATGSDSFSDISSGDDNGGTGYTLASLVMTQGTNETYVENDFTTKWWLFSNLGNGTNSTNVQFGSTSVTEDHDGNNVSSEVTTTTTGMQTESKRRSRHGNKLQSRHVYDHEHRDEHEPDDYGHGSGNDGLPRNGCRESHESRSHGFVANGTGDDRRWNAIGGYLRIRSIRHAIVAQCDQHLSIRIRQLVHPGLRPGRWSRDRDDRRTGKRLRA